MCSTLGVTGRSPSPPNNFNGCGTANERPGLTYNPERKEGRRGKRITCATHHVCFTGTRSWKSLIPCQPPRKIEGQIFHGHFQHRFARNLAYLLNQHAGSHLPCRFPHVCRKLPSVLLQAFEIMLLRESHAQLLQALSGSSATQDSYGKHQLHGHCLLHAASAFHTVLVPLE